MSKKKKAFVAPKYAEQTTLYEQLRDIRNSHLMSDRVLNDSGTGQYGSQSGYAEMWGPPTIVEDAENPAGRVGGTGPTAAVTGSSTTGSMENLGTSVSSSANSTTSSGLYGQTTLGDSLSETLDMSGWMTSDSEVEDENPPPADVSVAPETIQAIPSNSGIYHTVVPMKSLSFNICDNEAVIQQAGSYIVLGTDRPMGCESGYGGKGYQNANSIDLVVGRVASAKGTKGPAEGTMADNNPVADAARVYISQLTDIDVMFGLDGGVSGVAEGGSGVAVKADDVRIIGRRSVKIVTGNSKGARGAGPKGEWTSLGFSMHQPAPTIELLAGNLRQDRVVWGGIYNPIETISTVQRACLGGNTRDALSELNKTVGEIWSALFNLALIQSGYNATMGVDPFRPWVAAAAPVVGVANLDAVLNSLWHTKMNAILWDMNYLTPYGYKFICSTNIKLS
jgi:hypothetical protein